MSGIPNATLGDASSPRVDEPDGPHTINDDTKGTMMGLLKGLLFHLQNMQEFLDDLATGVNHSTTQIGHGVKTVTTAGADEVLVSESTPAKWLMIQAQTDNTGLIAVGGNGVDATVATGNGLSLGAGESVTIPVSDLQSIYIDATVSGQGVRYAYGT